MNPKPLTVYIASMFSDKDRVKQRAECLAALGIAECAVIGFHDHLAAGGAPAVAGIRIEDHLALLVSAGICALLHPMRIRMQSGGNSQIRPRLRMDRRLISRPVPEHQCE